LPNQQLNTTPTKKKKKNIKQKNKIKKKNQKVEFGVLHILKL